MNRALALLQSGEWEQGWKEYEWRWKTGLSRQRAFPQPLWDGAPLRGRRILLYAEQGIGDVLHFVRYAALVKERGGTVIVECHKPVAGILKSATGVDATIELGSPLPHFDVQAPLLSLPRIFGTTLATIPACVPYLTADATRAQAWRSRNALVRGLRIGVTWSGNPRQTNQHRRSVPPELLVRLSELPAVSIFAITPGPGPEPMICRDPEFSGMEDTAAMISELDLIISVDTMAAHLAGALAKPVWLLLAYAPCFRWLLKREDTPWYPTMRLFRQEHPGDWAAVMERVGAD